MTNPSLAILRALQLKPDAVFLLSDGLFDSSVVTLIPRLREHLLDPEGDGVKEQEMQTLRINTIAFMSDEGGPLLERIACENDGQYVYVRPAPENEDSWFTWLRAQVGKWKDKAKDDGDRGKENGRETQEDERGGE
jgi:hypothetical protein